MSVELESMQTGEPLLDLLGQRNALAVWSPYQMWI